MHKPFFRLKTASFLKTGFVHFPMTWPPSPAIPSRVAKLINGMASCQSICKSEAWCEQFRKKDFWTKDVFIEWSKPSLPQTRASWFGLPLILSPVMLFRHKNASYLPFCWSSTSFSSCSIPSSWKSSNSVDDVSSSICSSSFSWTSLLSSPVLNSRRICHFYCWSKWIQSPNW